MLGKDVWTWRILLFWLTANVESKKELCNIYCWYLNSYLSNDVDPHVWPVLKRCGKSFLSKSRREGWDISSLRLGSSSGCSYEKRLHPNALYPCPKKTGKACVGFILKKQQYTSHLWWESLNLISDIDIHGADVPVLRVTSVSQVAKQTTNFWGLHGRFCVWTKIMSYNNSSNL